MEVQLRRARQRPMAKRLLVFVSLLVLVIGFAYIELAILPNSTTNYPAIFLGLAGCAYASLYLLQTNEPAPLLRLDEDGLEIRSLLHNARHRWGEIGPIQVHSGELDRIVVDLSEIAPSRGLSHPRSLVLNNNLMIDPPAGLAETMIRCRERALMDRVWD